MILKFEFQRHCNILLQSKISLLYAVIFCFKKTEFLLQQKYEYTHLESKSNPYSLYYMYWLDVLVYDLAERSLKMIF